MDLNNAQQQPTNEEYYIQMYHDNHEPIFQIVDVGLLRDGGTKVIYTSKDITVYIHKDYNTFHNDYPPSDENKITDLSFYYYLIDRLRKYLEHKQLEVDMIRKLV